MPTKIYSAADKYKNFIIVFLSAIPFCFLVFLLIKYAVDVPVWEHWLMVPIFEKYYSNSLSISDFFEQYNGHRPLFPRIIILYLAVISKWNIFFELAFNLLLGLGIFIFVVHKAKKTFETLNTNNFLFALISLLIFSPSQWENWLFGWQIGLFLNVLVFIIGIILLDSPVFFWYRYLASIICGIIATYSFANGLLFWPIGMIVLIITLERQLKLRIILGWGFISFLMVASYFYGYRESSNTISLWYSLTHPLEYFKYIMAFLGSPVAGFWKYFSIFLGFVGICLFLIIGVLWLRFKFNEFIFWFAIGMYSISSALISGAGRIELGYGQALSSRYITISTLLWLSLLVLTYVIISNKFHHRFLIRKIFIGSLFSLFVLILISFGIGTTNFKHRHDFLLPAREELSCGVNDFLLERLLPSTDYVKRCVPILEKYRLSVFRDIKMIDEYKIISLPSLIGYVDYLEGSELPDGALLDGYFRLSGWAIDPVNKIPAKNVLVVNNNKIIAKCKTGALRMDVAEHFNYEKYKYSGWDLRIPAWKFHLGKSVLEIYAVMLDGTSIIKIGEKNINVLSQKSTEGTIINEYMDKPQHNFGFFDDAKVIDHHISAYGWARNAFTGEPAKEVFIVDENKKILAHIRVLLDRPDVANYFKDSRMMRSGWYTSFDMANLNPGKHVLRAYVFLRDEKKAILLNGEAEVFIR